MAAPGGEFVGEVAPASDSESDSRQADPAGRSKRHYPLDIPLPFDRYEHRLAARDILAHRIMDRLMSPSPSLAKAFEQYVCYPGDFRPVFCKDAQLGTDLNTLNKMLVTTYLRSQHAPTKPIVVSVVSEHSECCGIPFDKAILQGPRERPPTIRDQILDLLKRHYFESDNAAVRAWITSLSAKPCPGIIAPRYFGYLLANRGRLPPRFEFRVGAKADNWTHRESDNLKKMRPQLAVQQQLPLYDGGVFMSKLRRHMDGRALNGSRRGVKNNRWMIDCSGQPSGIVLGAAATWPGEYGTMRFFISSHWQDHYPDTVILNQYPHYRFDVSTNGYRGRNRDGIWCTGQDVTWSRRNKKEGRYGRTRRRCTSEPPPGAFTHAFLGPLEKLPTHKLVVSFPNMKVTEMDRRSRRRSLSRTRIEEMFDWDVDLAAIKAPASVVHTIPRPSPYISIAHCENCGMRGHNTFACAAPCGHCGAPNPNHRLNHLEMALRPENYPQNHVWSNTSNPAHDDRHREPHLAPDCPVLRHNRCKCLPFPFHIAARCGIPCRRDCGKLTDASPGSFQHRNAMLCRARCCMCGIKGHSGKECKLKRCRCGETHLGQDCSWKPECRVPGCGRYWCGVHCRDCGSVEKPFVQWRCMKCVGGDEQDIPEEELRGRRRRRRRRAANEKNEAAKDIAQSETVVAPPKTVTTSKMQSPVAPLPQTGREPPPSVFGGPRTSREAAAREGTLVKANGRQDDNARHA